MASGRGDPGVLSTTTRIFAFSEKTDSPASESPFSTCVSLPGLVFLHAGGTDAIGEFLQDLLHLCPVNGNRFTPAVPFAFAPEKFSAFLTFLYTHDV